MSYRFTLRGLLRDAATLVDRLHLAHVAFERFAIRNQVFALWQCDARRVAPAPLATADEWRALGASIPEGARPFSLLRLDPAPGPDVESSRLVFERRWFLESQIEANATRERTPDARPTQPAWSAAEALTKLGVRRLAFAPLGTSDTGYSFRRFLAIHPHAEHPEKVLLHELAHVELGHSTLTERRHGASLTDEPEELMAEAVALLVAGALGFDGAGRNAQSIERAARRKALSESDAERVFAVADHLLKAGKIDRARWLVSPRTSSTRSRARAAKPGLGRRA